MHSFFFFFSLPFLLVVAKMASSGEKKDEKKVVADDCGEVGPVCVIGYVFLKYPSHFYFWNVRMLTVSCMSIAGSYC